MSSRAYRGAKQRYMARLALRTEELPTLPICPACDGECKRVEDLGGGRYRAKRCRWCFGVGVIDPAVLALFERWLRILNASRLRGRCGRSSGAV